MPAPGGPPGAGRDAHGLRLAFLGLVNATAPFSTDPYLPALPGMVADLHASDVLGQLSLTTFLVGLAIGQPLSGAICDAHGRRRPMLAGAVLYTVGAAVCLVAPTIAVLVVFRGVQGLGAAAGIVGARAMVRDLVDGRTATLIFGRLFFVTGVAPIVAPLIGAGLETMGGWRSIFAFMTVFGVLLTVGIALLPETLEPEYQRSRGFAPVISDWRFLLRDRSFMALVLTLAFTVAAMFGYISSAAFVFRDRFGLGPTQFALAFGIGAAGFTVGNVAGSRIAARFAAPRAVASGCFSLLASAIWLTGVTTAAAPLALFLPAVVLLFVGVGMILPSTLGLALMPHPGRAGSAAALLGVAQFVIPGLLAPLIGIGGAGGIALPAYELVVSGLAAGCFFVLRPTGPPAAKPATAVDVTPAAG